MGWDLAEALNLRIGDEITLLTPNGEPTPFGVTPRRRNFEVLYVFKVGSLQIDAGTIFMPLAEAQSFFTLPDKVTEIEVMVDNPDQLDRYLPDVIAAAGDRFEIRTWIDRHGDFVDALGVERAVMFFILSMLVLIASMVIISGPDHAGEGKGAGHRDPAHHGHDAQRDFARVLYLRRVDWGDRHGFGGRARRHRRAQYFRYQRVHRSVVQRLVGSRKASIF